LIIKKTYRFGLYLLLLLTVSNSLRAQQQMRTEVLVVGGGTGGTAAGIQSARMGVNTIIAEPTQWLGGMVTAAGVAAFDGNHNMPSGIWAEFRERIYEVYGGPAKVATGWVSNTLFEPHTGDSIFKSFVAGLPNLKVLYRYRFQRAIIEGTMVRGAVFYDENTKRDIHIYASQVIDATELGDVMASAAIPFDIGMEAGSKTGEQVNIPLSNDIIQDLTYVAILKDYGPKADCTMVKPIHYDPMEFDGCCNEFCSNPSKLTSNVTAAKMLEYGKLPNGKYMINWPGKGNDIYLNLIPLNAPQRQEALKKAKAKTMRFVYFLQTHFGYKNLGLADDEFPTADRLPLIAYNREGRRLKGLVRLKMQHIADPFHQSQPLYRTGIAVGDYPIDHHHRENTNVPQHLGFYPVPSYNIPLGALIPEKFNGIIVAEKGISVSNVVNGTTRLQPVVMLTGQAAGMLAALAVKQKKQPRQVAVRLVQEQLLTAGAYIMPYYDVKPTHPHFVSIQKIGATGILKGKGEPFKWANRSWFYPDSLVSAKDFVNDYKSFAVVKVPKTKWLSIDDALHIIHRTIYPKGSMNKDSNDSNGFKKAIQHKWNEWGFDNFSMARNITRLELAVLLDKTLNPFQFKPVTIKGDFF
jgi:FAD dependent oxidoreductase